MADQVLRTPYLLGGLGFRTLVPWAVAAVLAAMAIGTAVAQEESKSPVRASLTADRNHLTVGDVVTLTLEVTHPADYAVVIPHLSREWGAFEVVSQSTAHTESNGDGTETTRQRLEVTLFAPGTFETPDLSISVRGPDGQVERIVPMLAQLTVSSVLSGSSEELRDIRPSVDPSPPLWQDPVVLAGAVLAVLAAIALAAFLVQHRLRGRDGRAVLQDDTRTHWEVAVQEIEQIERLDLPRAGRFKEHYSLLTGVIHAYVYAMFLEKEDRPDATGVTTDEIATAIWESPLDRKSAGLIVDLLLEADLVRFSNYPPSESEAHEASRRARDIVVYTSAAALETHQLDDSSSQPEAAT